MNGFKKKLDLIKMCLGLATGITVVCLFLPSFSIRVFFEKKPLPVQETFTFSASYDQFLKQPFVQVIQKGLALNQFKQVVIEGSQNGFFVLKFPPPQNHITTLNLSVYTNDAQDQQWIGVVSGNKKKTLSTWSSIKNHKFNLTPPPGP